MKVRRTSGRKKKGMDSDERGNDFMLLDVFSTAFIFTGSAEMAIQDTLLNVAPTDALQGIMARVRSGNDFERALRDARMSRDLSEWFCMVCSRSAADSEMMLDSWKAQALRCLAKVEDATSLVITFSSLLPVVMASIFLIIGYGSSLLAFSIVFITIAAFWLVSRWMRRLSRPLN
jgi:hypothetical protein